MASNNKKYLNVKINNKIRGYIMERISIIDSKHHVGEEVEINGWVANKRSSGKIAFLELRDGSAFFQGVVLKNEVGEELFEQATHLNQRSEEHTSELQSRGH